MTSTKSPPNKIKIKQLKCGCIVCISHCKIRKRAEIKTKNKIILLSRLIYEQKHGKIPKGVFVLHNCPSGDNPKCININHLWLGTQQDNMNDMLQKGRATSGETQWFHKLTEKQVRKIRKLFSIGTYIKYGNEDKRNKGKFYFKRKFSAKFLANENKVSISNIQKIVSGKSWKHLK
jgi:hypothetical protein